MTRQISTRTASSSAMHSKARCSTSASEAREMYPIRMWGLGSSDRERTSSSKLAGAWRYRQAWGRLDQGCAPNLVQRASGGRQGRRRASGGGLGVIGPNFARMARSVRMGGEDRQLLSIVSVGKASASVRSSHIRRAVTEH